MLFSYVAVVGTPDIGEEVTEEVDTDVSEREEESSCTSAHLLAVAAERVWNLFVENKREVCATYTLAFTVYMRSVQQTLLSCVRKFMLLSVPVGTKKMRE